MGKNTYTGFEEDSPETVQKRVRKIKKFYKELSSWAGTSVVIIAINLFLSGNISWAKYPVFFWGIFVLGSVFEVVRLQREQKAWEERQANAPPTTHLPKIETEKPILMPEEQVDDYSGELLNREEQERVPADLSEVRKLKRPWKDEDLV
jgi:hypothetical protein